MVHRDLSASHARHGFGGIWVYLHPLVIVGTYLLVFGFVLGSKIAVAAGHGGVVTLPIALTQHLVLIACATILGLKSGASLFDSRDINNPKAAEPALATTLIFARTVLTE
jgi:hypothetical protein